jgi:DNA-binding transcriptional MerR regulator
VSNRKALFTIGELARRTGLSARTIRFWSDEGIVPATARSAPGYRMYDVEAVARVDLVRTLRELGLDLDQVREVLQRQTTLADVAAAHVQALDAEIRRLKVHRAVLRSVAQRRSSTEEMRLMHKMAKLSAAERQQLIDEFVDKTFDGCRPDNAGARIAEGMRMLPSELPDDPTPEQVDAWVELTELIANEDFRASCRRMAVAGDTDRAFAQPFVNDQAITAAKRALADDVDPASAEARQILDGFLDKDMPAEERRKWADRLDTFTDRRVGRYWELLGILNGWPPRPSSIPEMEWIIVALRASG